MVVARSDASFADDAHELRIRFGGKDPSPEELERLGLPLVAGDW